MQTRLETLEDIFFEYCCLSWFREMKKKYKNSQLGHDFDDMSKTSLSLMNKHIRFYEKTFNEEFDLNKMKEIMK